MDPAVPSSTYDHALSFLYGRINYERVGTIPYRSQDFHLDRMRQLAARLGNLQDNLRIIHVAGTKGKGSTSAMIAAVLQRSGLRTGLYTSPHLERLEERFSVDGQPCTADELVALVEAIEPVVAELDREEARRGGRGPTFFEITTAMGLLHFARKHCEAVVLEVGLGGRLDSTNICQPRISVITSISFDHTRQLGNTLARIAREKAGIIKAGVPVISGVLPEEPRDVIQAVSREVAAPLYQLGREFHVRFHPPSAPGSDSRDWLAATMDYHESKSAGEISFANIRLGLLGEHQSRNAALAIAALLRLREQGWSISEAAIREGLASPNCPARVEVVSLRPAVIIDVAHNIASIAALMEVLDEFFAGRRRTFVFAASEDKDVRGMLERILPKCDRLILTRFCSNPRSVPSEELQHIVTSLQQTSGLTVDVVSTATPDAAWAIARSTTDANELICVTGSFFLAAELRPMIRA